jgi:hypothetical protein
MSQSQLSKSLDGMDLANILCFRAAISRIVKEILNEYQDYSKQNVIAEPLTFRYEICNLSFTKLVLAGRNVGKRRLQRCRIGGRTE